MTQQPSEAVSPNYLFTYRKKKKNKRERRKQDISISYEKLKGFQLLNIKLPETEPHPYPKRWKSNGDVTKLIRKKTKSENRRGKTMNPGRISYRSHK